MATTYKCPRCGSNTLCGWVTVNTVFTTRQGGDTTLDLDCSNYAADDDSGVDDVRDDLPMACTRCPFSGSGKDFKREV